MKLFSCSMKSSLTSLTIAFFGIGYFSSIAIAQQPQIARTESNLIPLEQADYILELPKGTYRIDVVSSRVSSPFIAIFEEDTDRQVKSSTADAHTFISVNLSGGKYRVRVGFIECLSANHRCSADIYFRNSSGSYFVPKLDIEPRSLKLARQVYQERKSELSEARQGCHSHSSIFNNTCGRVQQLEDAIRNSGMSPSLFRGF